ncbi:aquaporin, partial [Escherichia coli]|nr:aquaporin [Escherichia coli]
GSLSSQIKHSPGNPGRFRGNVAFTGGRDIPYFLVPLFGPIVGAIVGAFAYRKLIGRHLPCDICVVEEKETTTPSEQKASL